MKVNVTELTMVMKSMLKEANTEEELNDISVAIMKVVTDLAEEAFENMNE